MDCERGILHHTTIQTTIERQHSVTCHTTTLAGQKRYHDDGTSASGIYNAHGFQTAGVSKRAAPKLVASAIEFTDPAQAGQTRERSRHKPISSTPTSTIDRALLLSHPRYALPPQLVKNFAGLGIETIYPWQKSCLMSPGILTRARNLVYTAPTGGGKSLVADVLMLKRVLENKNAKALLVLPYVALVQEKVRGLRSIVQGITRKDSDDGPEEDDQKPKLWKRRADEDAIRVVGFFGGGKVRATWADFEIGVCTFEKANTLINKAIEDGSVSQLKAVVLDELHMVDDDHRGYLLELIGTKVLTLESKVQIVGMSATLSDINVLAKWLHAYAYQTAYRPILVKEHLVYDSNIYPATITPNLIRAIDQSNAKPGEEQVEISVPSLRIIQPSTCKELKDPVLNAVTALAHETVRSGYGVLVFCSSRSGCESDAKLISRVLPETEEIEPDVAERRADLLGDLRSLPSGLDPLLTETIPTGVAFHHAGLTTEEREFIADAYDNGIIKVVVATCSLAAGINLPARRVILHNARMGRDLVGPSMLRQMRGRAGRKGKDEMGETYLCCRKNDLEEVVTLMHAELPRVASGLLTEKRRIQRAILEIIAIPLATDRILISEYVEKTLLYLTANSTPGFIEEHIESSLKDLENMGLIVPDDLYAFKATQLGQAVVSSSLEPEDGVFVFREIQRALRAFVMDGDMHILYTFTPVQNFSITINWKVFRNELDALDESGLRVMSFVGIKPTIVNMMAQGGNMKISTGEEQEVAKIYNRFYLALQLRDLCNEVPVHVVARKYDMPRGTVQTLATTCQGFAAGIIKFCQHMGWNAFGALLEHVSDRLKAGAKADLLALAQITFIKSRTARVFYDNGYKTVAAVANADPRELVAVLMQAQPTKLRLKSNDEQKLEDKLLAKAQVISDSANRHWQIQMQQEIDVE